MNTQSRFFSFVAVIVLLTALALAALQSQIKHGTTSSAKAPTKKVTLKSLSNRITKKLNHPELAANPPVHPCSFASVGKVVELIENSDGTATNRPLTGLPNLAFRSTIVSSDNISVYPEPFLFPVDRKTAEIKAVNVDLPDIQQQAGYANVELVMPESYGKRFEVVDQFCEPKDPFDQNAAIGCPTSLNKSTTMSGFKLQCGANIEYGWYVRRKPYSLAGKWSLQRAVNEFPGFKEYFKAEICDSDAINGGNCSTFNGNSGSIYAAINSQVPIPTPLDYLLQIRFNTQRFIENFDKDTTSTGTRQQTVILNTFADTQVMGLPPGFVTTYNGCVPLVRPETKVGADHETPYRCELEVDEIEGFTPVDIFTAYVH
ncbi:MAG: hypothetical protein ACMG6E_02300 [Candidatus Roizmanbacteria bacterium]